MEFKASKPPFCLIVSKEMLKIRQKISINICQKIE